MGSEKKRKRQDAETVVETPDQLDKAERKRLKRLKKEKLKEAAAKEATVSNATTANDIVPEDANPNDVATPTRKAGKEDKHSAVNGSSTKKKKKKKSTEVENDTEQTVTPAKETDDEGKNEDVGNGSSSVKKKKREKREKKDQMREAVDGVSSTADADTGVNEVPALVSPIATPMAGRKLTKKLFKVIGQAAEAKALRRGIKEVVWSIRKDDKGVVVLAGDVFPVEVYAHIPLLCEEANIPYCFVSRKTDLGASGLTRRPTSVVLVSMSKAKGEVMKGLQGVVEEVKAIQNVF